MTAILDNFYDKSFVEINKRFNEDLLHAKERFTSRYGIVVDEQGEEFEKQMNSFNDWFLFDYKKESYEKENIFNKLKKEEILNDFEDKLLASFESVRRSVFVLVKNTVKKVVVKDLYTNKKVIISTGNVPLGFMEGDLFISRIITVEKSNFLLKGITYVSPNVLKIIKKEIKKIQKGKVDISYAEFLEQVEGKCIQSSRYSHLPVEEVFKF